MGKTKKLSEMMKAVSSSTAKAARKLLAGGGRKAAAASKHIAAMQLPRSLEWIFGFGFKVGIFLLLKSFLIIKYQYANLSVSGYWVIGSQVLQAAVLICCGVLMQNSAFYDEPRKLRRINRYYGYAFVLGVLVFVLREKMNLQFFKAAESVNWFRDIFSGMAKGAGEISLSLLFWDVDLWAMLCGVMHFIVRMYLHVSFPSEKSLLSEGVRRLLKPQPLRIEAAVQNDGSELTEADESLRLTGREGELPTSEASCEQETA